MKRFWKISLLAFGSVVGLVVVTLAVGLWLVFTPARLTPIVRGQLPRFVTCEAEVGRVELTFFSSFPRLGLRAEDVRMVNPVQGAPCDVLASLGEVRAALDVKALLRRDELLLSDIVFRDGTVCLFTDSLGGTNFDVVRPSPADDAAQPADDARPGDEEGLTLGRIDADDITLEDIDLLWADDSSGVRAGIRGLRASIRASMQGDAITAAVTTARPVEVDFSAGPADSLLAVSVRGLTLAAEASKTAGVVEVGRSSLAAEAVWVAYAGTQYLNGIPLSISTTASADLAARRADIRDLTLSLGGLSVALEGMLAQIPRGLEADIRYKLSEWPLDELLGFVPDAFISHIEGVEASGRLSSEGRVRGVMGQGSMPVIDANVAIDDGRVVYPDMLPWPLREISAALDIHLDQNANAARVGVSSLGARTPRSQLRASGGVEGPLSDPRADIALDLDADLADAAPFIPSSVPLSAVGRVSGRVKADASVSALRAMRLDEVRLSASLLATGLDARYDTIFVASPSARLDLALPNPDPSSSHASFAAASLSADRLDVSSPDRDGLSPSGFVSAVSDVRLSLETSDVTAEGAIPAVVCNFTFGHLSAEGDTGSQGEGISVSVASPGGRISMAPGRRGTAQRIQLAYNGGALRSRFGDVHAALDTLGVSASVSYDGSEGAFVPTAQGDLWQKLAPRGNIVSRGVRIDVPSLDYPVLVPALAMDLTPRRAEIHEARVVLDDSDFSLDGAIDNIVPYFRGDSVLRAEFNFSSPVTNVTRLMALTSGIGGEQDEIRDAADEFSGPYMVPRGVDVTLHAGIGEMLWNGGPLFSNIEGDVQIRDGALFISPRLSFDSPATHGEVQLMYRTPDRNNLLAGVSIRLDGVEIGELGEMIPDLGELMPMLSSFGGRGEFRAAAEGYMDSTYRFKMSTLRGAGSIGATNLTIRDDETFRKIAFLLKYRDEGVIRVDSLRAEFTVFRGEIDIYPFLLGIDRYKAVVSGRHNLDMNFDYNISLVQSPLPFRVAVDVQGRSDDLQFKVFSRSRYPEFYRPAYQGVVENRQMELRNIIRDSLTPR